MKKFINFFLFLTAYSAICQKQPTLGIKTQDTIMMSQFDTINTQNTKETATIKILSKIDHGAIKLRLVPNKQLLWVDAYTHGILLYRKAHGDTIEKVLNNGLPLKPYAKELWESEYNKASEFEKQYIAIAAEAIFGTSHKKKGISIIDRVDMLANLYAFHMLAAEFSPIAARLSGLSYIDKDIEQGKKYYYSAAPVQSNPIYQLGYDFQIPSFERDSLLSTLYPLSIDSISNNDGNVTISWNNDRYKNYYSGYLIERAIYGSNEYIILNKQPLVLMWSPDLMKNKNTITYTDSVSNYTKYNYRIKGINSFGEVSEPSEPIEGMARDKTPPPQPYKVTAKYLGNKKIEISWEYPKDNVDLVGFKVARAGSSDQEYVILTESNLSKSTRTITDEIQDESLIYYYIVAALDSSNNASVSVYSMVALPDTMAPAPPGKISYTIDSLGHTVLTWPMGKEKDLRGYLVSYSNSNHEALNLAHNSYLRDTVFYDSIQVLSLTEEAYYAIQAIDMNNNVSSYSNRVKIVKPDIVPPVAPLFKDYKVSDSSIFISWIPSSSKDVVYHQLYRKKISDSIWAKIKIINKGEQSEYEDENTEEGKMYVYKITAFDDAGLESPSDKSLTLKSKVRKYKIPLSEVKIKLVKESLVLEWESSDAPKEWLLYKAKKGEVLSLVSNLDGKVSEFKDNNVTQNEIYEYAFKAVGKDNKVSDFSKRTVSPIIK